MDRVRKGARTLLLVQTGKCPSSLNRITISGARSDLHSALRRDWNDVKNLNRLRSFALLHLLVSMPFQPPQALLSLKRHILSGLKCLFAEIAIGQQIS